MKHAGFNESLEKAHQQGDEWQFGATSQPCLAQIPIADREKYLPDGENQFGTSDFEDCATRSPLNALEMKFNWLLAHNIITPDNKAWLTAQGYLKGGKVVFCKRYIAILSGTTVNGNSLKAPVDAIRKYGLIPEAMLAQTENMSAQEYLGATITQAMKDQGAQFLARFPINYEQVPKAKILDVAKTEGVGVALFAWPNPVDGIYPATNEPFDHAQELYAPEYLSFDNYDPYKKHLASDYIFFDYGYRIYIAGQNTIAVTDEVKKNLIVSLYTTLVQKLKELLLSLQEQNPDATLPVKPPPVSTPPAKPMYDFSTREAAIHSVRLIADAQGLPLTKSWSVDGVLYLPKDILCACIEQESHFDNKAVGDNGTSKDWGICQINDYFQVGKGKPFKDVPSLLDHPEDTVKFMVTMMKAGKLSLWSSYKTGAFKKYLPWSN